MTQQMKNPTGGNLSGGSNSHSLSSDHNLNNVSNIVPTMKGGGVQEAVVFLEWYRPQGLMNLVAIPQDGGSPIAITRQAGDPDLESFIEKHNGSKNLYFSVNEPKENSPDKKLSEDDIAFIHAVCSDVDPQEGKIFNAERARITAQSDSLLADPKCPPSLVINSGGGDQHFWKFEPPLDAQLNFQECKDIGADLKIMTGGDAVQNIDRIMRLPGTTNLPNKKKQSRGQPLAIASIYKKSEKTYILDDLQNFTKKFRSPHVEQPQEGAAAQSWDLMDLHPDLVTLICDGAPVGERSEKFYHVIGWLKDENYSIKDITKILEAHPGGIAEKYKGRLLNEVKRCYGKIESKDSGESPSYKKDVEIRLYTITELMNRPPPEYIVDGILMDKGVTILGGHSGDMKSFVAIYLGLSVATGQSVGQCNVKQGGVVYCLNEGQGGFPYRTRAWCDRYNQHQTDSFRIVETTPNLMDTKRLAPYIEAIEKANISPRMIVIDTFSKATIGGEGNSEKDMAKAIDSAYELGRKFDCLVLLIDHIGKDPKKGLRGSSAKFSNADSVCIVKKTKRSEWETIVTLTVEKMKDGEDGKDYTFMVEMQNVAGKSIPVLVSTAGTNEKMKQKDWIRSRISLDGRIQRKQLKNQFLAEYPDSSEGSFRVALSKLTSAELLCEVDGFIRETDE